MLRVDSGELHIFSRTERLLVLLPAASVCSSLWSRAQAEDHSARSRKVHWLLFVLQVLMSAVWGSSRLQ